jgi:ATP-binding cassette subfamily C (CFTR/MRP) protein 1
MFTSISLILLLCNPLTDLFQSIPTFTAAVGCFSRVEKYLLADSRVDHRLVTLPSQTPDSFDSKSRASTRSHPTAITSGDIELSVLSKTQTPDLSQFKDESLDSIIVRNGSFGWLNDGLPVLQDINLAIPKHKLTLVVGPVASGKSTLLKAFLGETLSSKGFVHIPPGLQIAFCDQTPWLTNTTLQKNVLGFSNFDGAWYKKVIHACALDDDLSQFSDYDQALVGSNGVTLSGGQKQRLVKLTLNAEV